MKLIVVGLAIIQKSGKILIGRRKSRDPYIKDLTWVFPGGKLKNLDFEAELKREVREEAGLEIEVRQLTHVRVFPDAKENQIICFYFYCTPVGGEEKAAGDLQELKWVRPTETYRKYFTTHTAAEVKQFLRKLENGCL